MTEKNGENTANNFVYNRRIRIKYHDFIDGIVVLRAPIHVHNTPKTLKHL